MKENDIILGTFADKYLSTLPDNLLVQYSVLLQEVDPDLFQWITNKVPVPERLDNEIMKMLKKHVRDNPTNYKRVLNYLLATFFFSDSKK